MKPVRRRRISCNRSSRPQAPNEKWVAHISHVHTAEGWLYLAAVMDIFSRRIVCWAMGSRLTQYLAIRALDMELQQRRPQAGLLHHSDRRSQYTSEAYQARLTPNQLQLSMSGVGYCYDNAAMESFFATLKTKLVHHEQYQTRTAARMSIFDYIERFYNRRRLHSTLGYLSPLQFERSWAEKHSLTRIGVAAGLPLVASP